MSELYSKADYDAVATKPCTCVYCDFCHGTGNIRVHYDACGRMEEAYGDDLDDLEPCDQCHGGIMEVCERCQLLEEMYQDAQEHEERTQRAGLP